jgi:hypothetical protein
MYPFKDASGNEVSVELETNAGEKRLGIVLNDMTLLPTGRSEVNR